MKRPFLLFLITLLAAATVCAQKHDKKGEKWVEKTLSKLTLRQKIGQMINFRVSGEYANFESDKFKEARELVEKHGIGGFTVYRGNANSVAALTNELQRISNVPLLFAADYERGLRMQMPTGTPFTTAMGLGATGDTGAAYRQGKIVCEEMRAIGVNWLFGPVADLNNNPDNPVINIRSFGEDPVKVGEFVSAMSRGVSEANCLSTLKHFPGHGDTNADSHIGLSVVNIDRTRLNSVELVPFKAGIAAGVGSVMTAHVAVPLITGDEIPGTLNPKITTDLLRTELVFDGIIVTDSMEMGAIVKTYSRERSVVMAVQAGADVVLLPLDVGNAIDSIESAINRGEIKEDRINSSVRRLLAAKYRLGLVTNRFTELAKVNQIVEKPENVNEANATAERSMTLLKNDGVSLPLSTLKAARTLFIIIAADDDPVEGGTLVPEIRRRLPEASIYRFDLRTTQAEYDSVVEESKRFDAVVLAPFVKRAANKGTVALPEQQTTFVRRMIGSQRPVAVIAFGSPYLVRQFPEVRTYAVTYGIEDVAQYAAAKVIFGEAPFRGHLPITIPGLFPLGSGISK